MSDASWREDGSDVIINAGESYLIPPGHLPEVRGGVWCELNSSFSTRESSNEWRLVSDGFMRVTLHEKFCV